jgi:hypothetical protein
MYGVDLDLLGINEKTCTANILTGDHVDAIRKAVTMAKNQFEFPEEGEIRVKWVKIDTTPRQQSLI